MADTTALSAAPPPTHGPTPRAAVARPPAGAMDLYSETPDLGTRTADGAGVANWFGEDGFDFKDVLDIVNPLQHLPVVGTLYRALTDDTLAPGPRILGGTLFGGIAGFVSSIANAVYENETGKDFGDTALALVTGDDTAGPAVASATAAKTVPAAPAPAAATEPAPLAAPYAAIIPTAPSPLAIAGHAKAPGIPLAAPGTATEDPVAALISARSAVPATRNSAATGLPATNFRSSLKMPDGRAVPIEFKQKVATADARGAEPPAAKAEAPRPLQPAAGPSKQAAASDVKHVAPGGVQADVPVLMRQALEKYETLMKSRTTPGATDVRPDVDKVL